MLEVWTEGVKNVSWKLELQQPLGFSPGQFVMVQFDGVGSKAMSMASSPSRPYVELSAELSESSYKKKWVEVKAGDSVNIVGPYGIFTFNEAEPKIAFIAGGIGITPFKSMMEYVADKKLPNDLLLLYSNRTPELIAYKKELDALGAQNANIKTVYTITRPQESPAGGEWRGPTGRIDAHFIEKHAPDYKERLWYLCAGDSMVAGMLALLESMGVDRKRIKREVFTGLH